MNELIYLHALLEQECAALKKVYGEFYHQLVDVLSDGDTHHSIVSDLHKKSIISDELAAQMTSTQERGRSLLTVLGLEEKPHRLRELMTVMMEVDKAKSLAKEMTAKLSKSEQGNPHTVCVCACVRVCVCVNMCTCV